MLFHQDLQTNVFHSYSINEDGPLERKIKNIHRKIEAFRPSPDSKILNVSKK